MAAPRWLWALGTALIAIPVAIAVESSRRKRGLGAVDPMAKTGAYEHKPVEVDENPDDPDNPYMQKPPKDVGDCLVLGKDHPLHKFGEYRVCLTPNQKKTLFKNKKGRKLGCGVFACAYGTRDPDKIVKFTRDSEDVAALLEAQELGVVPKVFATYKLKDGGHSIKTDDETPVYALVVERLKTFSPVEREILDNELHQVRDLIEAPDIRDACSTIRDDGGDCSAITQQTAEAARKLREAGIDWSDIHSGNIGLDKQGNVKILDLGITGTQLKEQPKILEGPKRKLSGQLPDV